MTSPSSPPPPRASDAQREAVVRTLQDAVVRGLLTMDEGDERIAAAFAAKFVHDLPPLTADLPPAPLPAPVAPGWRMLATLAWLQLRTALAGVSWRGARARPRLAVAVLALVAVLSIVAGTAAGFDGPMRPHGPHLEHFQHR
jgi:hypothetical protein